MVSRIQTKWRAVRLAALAGSIRSLARNSLYFRFLRALASLDWLVDRRLTKGFVSAHSSTVFNLRSTNFCLQKLLQVLLATKAGPQHIKKTAVLPLQALGDLAPGKLINTRKSHLCRQ